MAVDAARGRDARAIGEVPSPTREQRAAYGKAARRGTPRGSHAEFVRDPACPDPLTLLAGQDAERVPELVPLRYGRMAASAFSYFRGAALPMASDLAGTPRTGLTAQLCGDAHLGNFGMFGSPERRLIFDINDFDETAPGPWEWDVKRLAASLEVAGRDNDVGAGRRRDIVVAAVAAYRHAMRDFARRPALEVWYALGDVATLQAGLAPRLSGARRAKLRGTIAKAYTRDHLGSLGRFAGVRDGRPCIAAAPPLITPVRDLVVDGADVAQGLQRVLDRYRANLEPDRRVLLDRYRLVDVARKVVGVGSVGTRTYMVLLLGDDPDDALFLQAKEAGPSVLERFLGPSGFGNNGERIVVGQRLVQTVGDIFLSWVRAEGFDGRDRDFHLRQLRDWKGSADIGSMGPRELQVYGELCGWTLAKAHARSGDRIAIAAYLGSGPVFDRAVAEFARVYADRNERDHRDLVAAIDDGRIAADPTGG
ncbi:Uncharacterized conserved protein, DUF2252 family [Pseudonocardia ammonioxydans]|uniref:Uncharacterized conserved protein, DUF2252 family n=1 Tax=Pseudonocardia ammonioxydans TaxID=260086 RepID=A0A1I4X2H7_PSUAM|nr:DUF2252 domain-containing protein [Pseudonocardia ammonioxydans]SFN20164.1 Uncharacterized conserved protein, DUF2252 family [Pseudonocardia ammonioxydans]